MMRRRRRKQSTISASTARLLLFGSFFCAGSVVGFLSTRFVSNDARNQITAYLQAYVACTAGKAAAGTFFAVFVSYLRYPLIAFLIGILGGGMLLLPLLCTAQGFSLAFAVQCFAAGFGRQGTLTALSLFGIRSLFVLPCTLYLACAALRSENQRQPYAANDYGAFGVCVGILLLGALLDLTIVPKLLQRVLL